ncbi:hypothetical protein [Streptomyces sp. NPDC087525]|uniref:hypothetical protein n=1 Tax=Streptomyces sp. NPDC087525 TaxID=3365793 RepID=UPI003818CABB
MNAAASAAHFSASTLLSGSVWKIRSDLDDRIAEAERAGRLGEAEVLRVSLAVTKNKAARLDDRRRGADHQPRDSDLPQDRRTRSPHVPPDPVSARRPAETLKADDARG